MRQVVHTIPAKAYIADSEAPDEYWYEGDYCRVEVERTDQDEIRIGTHIREARQEAASLYLSRSGAIDLMIALGATIGDR